MKNENRMRRFFQSKSFKISFASRMKSDKLVQVKVFFLHSDWINRMPYSPYISINRRLVKLYAVACCVGCTLPSAVVTIDTASVTLSSFSVIANHGKRFWSSILWIKYTQCTCNKDTKANENMLWGYLYRGWLIAYTYGSRQATNLQAQAGIYEC